MISADWRQNNQRGTIEEGNGWRSTNPQYRRLRQQFCVTALLSDPLRWAPWPRFFWITYHFRGVEYPLFLFAIALTVWYAGVGPGILAVVLSSISFNYFFTEPRFSFYVSRADIPYYLMFILFALLLTWFSAVRRRVEQRLLQSRDTLEGSRRANPTGQPAQPHPRHHLRT